MAMKLGARGGRARALRLTADRRRRIAALGGAARRESLAAARRIADNFSVRRKIGSLVLHIASDEDLLELKPIAHADRAAASDAQDIAFLEARRSRPRA